MTSDLSHSVISWYRGCRRPLTPACSPTMPMRSAGSALAVLSGAAGSEAEVPRMLPGGEKKARPPCKREGFECAIARYFSAPGKRPPDYEKRGRIAIYETRKNTCRPLLSPASFRNQNRRIHKLAVHSARVCFPRICHSTASDSLSSFPRYLGNSRRHLLECS